jgi:hypothetical protein
MQPRIMITNNGQHSPDKQAETTAWKILEIVRIPEEPVAADNPDRASVEAGREAARQAKVVLEPQLTAVLTPHHTYVQAGERTALDSDGAKQMAKAAHAAGHVDETTVLAEVNAILAQSSFATHFARPDVQDLLKQIVADEFARSIKEERGWFETRGGDKGGKGRKVTPASA